MSMNWPRKAWKSSKYLLMALIIHISALMNSAVFAISAKQQVFMKQMVTLIRDVNQKVLVRREKLKNLHQLVLQKKQLTLAEKVWLKKAAERYKMKTPKSEADWEKLLRRVDILPVSLVLAQAINESAWGQSRFARDANNLFGRWCFKAGCGLVPAKRSKGATHEVKRFSTKVESIEDYLRNINSNDAYTKLRLKRRELEKKKSSLHGIDIADGLSSYSSRGRAYVADIKAIIKRYDLGKYDS